MNRQVKWRKKLDLETQEVNRTISPMSRDVKAAHTLSSNVGDSRHISEGLGNM